MHLFIEESTFVEKSPPEEAAPQSLDLDVVIEQLAFSQHGVVTLGQFREAGFSARMVQRRVQKGRFTRLHREVLRIGVGHFPQQAEMAAVLACGADAVLSHRSAAALWGLLPPATDKVRHPQVTVVGSRRGVGVSGVAVHRTGISPVGDRTVRDGIPVTSPVRTLLDLAALAVRGVRKPPARQRPAGPTNRLPTLAVREVEQAVARAERDGLVTYAELRERLAASRHRAGVPLLRRVLDAEGGAAFTRSEAERRLLEWIRRGDLPRPELNVRTGKFEVDFLWRASGLAVEVDGYAFHHARDRFEADRARDAELAAGGIQVLRVTWRQIRDQPEVVLVRLARALEQATRRAGA